MNRLWCDVYVMTGSKLAEGGETQIIPVIGHSALLGTVQPVRLGGLTFPI